VLYDVWLDFEDENKGEEEIGNESGYDNDIEYCNDDDDN
jgi:hypothetical protein